MKTLFSLILILALTSCAVAQTVTPRFGVGKNQDQTGRTLTWNSLTVTPTSTLVTIKPNAYTTLINVPSSSIVPTFTANVSQSYCGDELIMFVAANSTSRLATFSTNIIAATTTVAITASKKATFKMVFDGAKFVLTSSTVEP